MTKATAKQIAKKKRKIAHIENTIAALRAKGVNELEINRHRRVLAGHQWALIEMGGNGISRVGKVRIDFYRSDEWRALRYKALKRDGRECVCCGARPGNGIVLHVDHIKPRSKYPELELSLDNLQVLCEDCNLGKSNTDSIDYRKKVN